MHLSFDHVVPRVVQTQRFYILRQVTNDKVNRLLFIFTDSSFGERHIERIRQRSLFEYRQLSRKESAREVRNIEFGIPLKPLRTHAYVHTDTYMHTQWDCRAIMLM